MRIAFAPPFIAVADGVSAPYDSEHPLRFFGGMTGGQFAARTLCARVAASSLTDTIDHIIQDAMERIAVEQGVAGIPRNRSDLLGGAGFALAKISTTAVQVATVGDCFALWRLRDGTVGATRDQVAAHDRELRAIIPAMRAEVGDDFNALFARLNPIRREKRLRDINGDGPSAFGLLWSGAGAAAHGTPCV